jgi:hypothetical protein
MISKEVIEDGMGRIPARNDVDLSKVIESKLEISLAESAKNGEQIPYWSTAVTVSQEQAFLQSVVAGAMAGSKTAQEAAEQLQKAGDDYRSQHK